MEKKSLDVWDMRLFWIRTITLLGSQLITAVIFYTKSLFIWSTIYSQLIIYSIYINLFKVIRNSLLSTTLSFCFSPLPSYDIFLSLVLIHIFHRRQRERERRPKEGKEKLQQRNSLQKGATLLPLFLSCSFLSGFGHIRSHGQFWKNHIKGHGLYQNCVPCW